MPDLFQFIDDIDADKQAMVVKRLEDRAQMPKFAAIRENYFDRIGLPISGRIHNRAEIFGKAWEVVRGCSLQKRKGSDPIDLVRESRTRAKNQQFVLEACDHPRGGSPAGVRADPVIRRVSDRGRRALPASTRGDRQGAGPSERLKPLRSRRLSSRRRAADQLPHEAWRSRAKVPCYRWHLRRNLPYGRAGSRRASWRAKPEASARSYGCKTPSSGARSAGGGRVNREESQCVWQIDGWWRLRC